MHTERCVATKKQDLSLVSEGLKANQEVTDGLQMEPLHIIRDGTSRDYNGIWLLRVEFRVFLVVR